MPVPVLFIGAFRFFLGVYRPSYVLAGFAAGAMVLVAGSLAVQFAYPSHD